MLWGLWHLKERLEIHTKRWLENVEEEASIKRRRIRDNSIKMDLRKIGFGSGGGGRYFLG
jgi:hypothetical protein